MTEIEVTSLLLKLSDYGVTGIMVQYDGGGDSGAIEKIGYTTVEIENADDIEMQIDDIWSAPDLRSLIDNDTYIALDNYIHGKCLDDIEDWWNNEGGFGVLYLHVASGEFVIRNNIRITEVETYGHRGNLRDNAE